MDNPQRVWNMIVAASLLLVLLYGQGPAAGADEPQPMQLQSMPNPQDKGQALQFMGLVEPGRHLAVMLMPGEYLKHLLVHQGQEVRQGDIIAHLSNDQLISGLADLQQKRTTIQQNAQQSQLLQTEITVKKKQLAETEEEIDREKRLAEKVEGYSSTLTRQLQSQQQQLAGQLAILEHRYSLAAQSDSDNKELEAIVDEQVKEIRRRIDALTIRSPFDGRVHYAADNPGRIPPGGIVCEVRDESFFIVRGTIIQHQYLLIESGDTVTVTVDFIPGRVAHGIVQSISQATQKQQVHGYASFEVLIRVDDAQSLLQSGMVVSIHKKTATN